MQLVAIVQTPRAALLEQGSLIGVLGVSMVVIYGLQFFLFGFVFGAGLTLPTAILLTAGQPDIRGEDP
jgi:hypothetical protein